MDGRLIRQVVLYIIDNHTIDEAAEHFKLSRGTIIKYTNLARTKGPYYNYEIASKLNEAMERNSNLGKIRGGKNGHVSYVISNSEAIRYAKEVMENNKTLRQIANDNNLNVSTLYNSLMRINDKKVLQELKEYYGHNMEVKRDEVWRR